MATIIHQLEVSSEQSSASVHCFYYMISFHLLFWQELEKHKSILQSPKTSLSDARPLAFN
jgi:hypothetical protein